MEHPKQRKLAQAEAEAAASTQTSAEAPATGTAAPTGTGEQIPVTPPVNGTPAAPTAPAVPTPQPASSPEPPNLPIKSLADIFNTNAIPTMTPADPIPPASSPSVPASTPAQQAGMSQAEYEELQRLRQFKEQAEAGKYFDVDPSTFSYLSTEAYNELEEKVLTPLVRKFNEKLTSQQQELVKQAETIQQDMLMAEQRRTDVERTRSISRLTDEAKKQVPDIYELMNDIGFQRFLTAPQANSPYLNGEVLQAAVQRNNIDSIVSVFNTYKQSLGMDLSSIAGVPTGAGTGHPSQPSSSEESNSTYKYTAKELTDMKLKMVRKEITTKEFKDYLANFENRSNNNTLK